MGAGRRQRVREKVHLNGIAGLAPHEILEFMLYPYVPQKDTVPIAHALLDEFGTMDNVLHATEEALLTVPGMPKLAALTFPQLRHIIARAATDAAVDRGRITDAVSAAKYFNAMIGGEKVEKTVAVFLTNRGKIICARELNSGTPVETDVEIRKIASAALNTNAAAVILGHNHPSGDVTPSEADISSTEFLGKILRPLGVALLDHLVVSGNKYHSMLRGGSFRERVGRGSLNETGAPFAYDTEGKDMQK